MSCKKLACFLTASTIMSFNPASPAMADSQNAISLSIEALLLSRTLPAGTAFTGPDRPGRPFVPFDANDLKNRMTGGGRFTADISTSYGMFQVSLIGSGKLLSKGQIRDQGFGGPADTNATYDDDLHLNPGSDVGSTGNSDQLAVLDIRTRSQFVGAEVNWQTGHFFKVGNFTPFIGARFMQFNENLRSLAFDEPDDFFGTDNDIDRVGIKTINNLIGVQIGLAGFHPLTPNIFIGGKFSGGLFLNRAKRKRSFSRDNSATDTFNDSLSKSTFAQIIEANPQVRYKFSDKAYLTVGGFVMWINGISAAGSHYNRATDFDDRAIRANKSALPYGGTVGVTFNVN